MEKQAVILAFSNKQSHSQEWLFIFLNDTVNPAMPLTTKQPIMLYHKNPISETKNRVITKAWDKQAAIKVINPPAFLK